MAVYWIVAVSLIRVLHVTPILASIMSHLIAGVTSYVGHWLYSFRVAADHTSFAPKFFIVALLALVINIIVMQCAAALGYSYSVGLSVLTIVIPFFNYVANRFWVFASGLNEVSIPTRKLT